LGSLDQLQKYTEAAAGTGDHNNYFTTLQKQMRDTAKNANITVPPDLGFSEKILSDDPVALNLLRLAITDRLLTACKDAGVPQIVQMRFEPGRMIPWPFEEEAQADPKKKPGKDSKDNAQPKIPVDRLVQFPIRILISAPERNLSQFLFELQRPSDNTHGYFVIRGFHVSVRTAGSGRVESAVALAALLNEKTLSSMGISIKGPEDRRSVRDYDDRSLNY